MSYIVQNDYPLSKVAAIHRFTIFPFDFASPEYNDRATKKGTGTKELEKLKHLSKKIQEAISNIIITETNEKLCQTTGTQGAFSDKVIPDIDGFTDEPMVQYVMFKL